MKKIIFLLLIICTVLSAVILAEETSLAEYSQAVSQINNQLSLQTEAARSGEAPPIKSLTPYIQSLRDLAAKSGALLPTGFQRRDDLSDTYDTDHFRIHYTTTGVDAVYHPSEQNLEPGVPDYVVNTGLIIEEVWNAINTMGFPDALPDAGQGGNNLVDLYLVDIQAQTGYIAYGFSVPEAFVTSQTAYGYMIIDNDYQSLYGTVYANNPLNAVRVTCAHEFFHLIQFAMDMFEIEGSSTGLVSASWSEMSSTFMEEVIYDYVNDYYSYLPYFFKFPQWSLRRGPYNTNMDFHQYGSVMFPIFLSENFSPSIFRDIWDGCASFQGPNWWLAADTAIRNTSGDTETLQTMFKKFTLWNLFTKNWTRTGEYYGEALMYPSVSLTEDVNQYPNLVDVDDTLLPDDLGANYILLENYSPTSDTLVVAFDGDRTMPWGIQVVGLPTDPSNLDSVPFIDPREFDSTAKQIIIGNVSDYRKIILIASVLGQPTAPGAFSAPNFRPTINYRMGIIEYNGEGLYQPVGGEQFSVNVPETVAWYMDDSVDSVKIEISTNGVTWQEVAVVPNILVYNWVPQNELGEYYMRISDVGSSGKVFQTTTTFSITGTVTDKILDPYPNPAWMQIHDGVKFKGLIAVGSATNEMRVHIVNLAGEKVRSLEGKPSGGSVTVKWDFKNKDGQTVAAGMYMAVIEFGDLTELKKFFVYR